MFLKLILMQVDPFSEMSQTLNFLYHWFSLKQKQANLS